MVCDDPANYTTSTWHYEKTLPIQLGVFGLAQTSYPGTNEIIAVGGYGGIFENTDSNWKAVTIPDSSPFGFLRAIGINGHGNALIVGDYGMTPIFQKYGRWNVITPSIPIPTNLYAIWGNPDPISDEFFAVGSNGFRDGFIYRITKNGTVWRQEAKNQFDVVFNGVYGIGYQEDLQVYMVGNYATIVVRKNGEYEQIDQSLLPIDPRVDLQTVWISEEPNHPVYVGGKWGTLLKYENGEWKQEELPETYNGIPTKQITFYAIQGVGNEIVVVGSRGAIFHKFGKCWTTEGEGITDENLTSITYTSTPFKITFFVGGSRGTILRYY